MPDDKGVADRLFDAQLELGSSEDDAAEALLTACGLDYDKPGDWPVRDWWFDYYDASFEFGKVRPGWQPTAEQLRACGALGFARFWINYDDGTAFVASAPTWELYPTRHSETKEDRQKQRLVQLAVVHMEEDYIALRRAGMEPDAAVKVACAKVRKALNCDEEAQP